MSSISRNQSCTCGSGKRYKHCCGSASHPPAAGMVQPAWRTLMHEALALQLKEDLAAAEVLYRKVLALNPDEPDTLHMLGVICYQTHRHAEALELIARAIDLVGKPVNAIYDNLGLALSAALAGNRSEHAARSRAAYADWKTRAIAPDALCHPLVSVVVPHQGDTGTLLASLQSLHAQSYRGLEIIVVGDGDADQLRAILATGPFPIRIVAASGMPLHARLNRGVEQASGTYIGVLMPGDRHDPQRLEKMVEGVVHRGGEWGFSAVRDARSGATPAVFNAITGQDTVGYALLDQANVLTSASNLFFSRALFDTVGGFDASPAAPEQSFALRALPHAEPFYVENAECECAASSATGRQTGLGLPAAGAAEALRRYYADAVDCAPPANPFAPVLSVWQNQFIYKLASSKHLKYLRRDALHKFLAAGIAAQITGASSAMKRQPGLDLVSFFSGEFGLAESARGIAQACHVGDIPFGLKSIDLIGLQRAADRSMDAWLSDACTHAAIVLMCNPDSIKAILPQLGQDELRGRYRIGYWYWETEQLPVQWLHALELVDEIWVATEFVAQAARKFTTKPVRKIRPPIKVQLSRPYARSEFGLQDARFLFLFSFDFGSFSIRKNPQATIRAFQQAFPPDRQDVGLVIKSHGGAGYPERLQALQQQIQDDPRITLIDRMMSRDQVTGLQSVCDVFVSLHRAEGLGLGLAECMALGKPVIGTAYSGNLEFMRAENSCLVDFDLIPIEAGQYLHDQPGVCWAEPRIDHAAAYMQRLADDGAYYRQIATAGQQDIVRDWTHQATADAIRHRLNELDLLKEAPDAGALDTAAAACGESVSAGKLPTALIRYVSIPAFEKMFGCRLNSMPQNVCVMGWMKPERHWYCAPESIGIERTSHLSRVFHNYGTKTLLGLLSTRVLPRLDLDTLWFPYCFFDAWRERTRFSEHYTWVTPPDMTDWLEWRGAAGEIPILSPDRPWLICQGAHRGDPSGFVAPDSHYLRQNRYAELFDQVRQHGMAWADKKPRAILAAADHGESSNFFVAQADPALHPRRLFKQMAEAQGLPIEVHLGGKVSLEEQLGYRYIADVDGYARTWSAWAWKMMSGSTVLSVDSPWTSFFTDQFSPWEHYVPIANDCSDLAQKMAWCETHADECRAIAERARAHALVVYDLATVTERMVSQFRQRLIG